VIGIGGHVDTDNLAAELLCGDGVAGLVIGNQAPSRGTLSIYAYQSGLAARLLARRDRPRSLEYRAFRDQRTFPKVKA
jgi:hypothetical protein